MRRERGGDVEGMMGFFLETPKMWKNTGRRGILLFPALSKTHTAHKETSVEGGKSYGGPHPKPFNWLWAGAIFPGEVGSRWRKGRGGTMMSCGNLGHHPKHHAGGGLGPSSFKVMAVVNLI